MPLLVPQGQNHEIVFRHREKRLTPDFLRGLTCAILFHILFFALLRISSPSPPQDLLLPYTAAVAEIGTKTVLQLSWPESFMLSFEESSPLFSKEHVHSPKLFTSNDLRNIGLEVEPDFSPLEKVFYIPFKEEEL